MLTTNHNQIDNPVAGPLPEILAPAGGPAQFFAALSAGADAVFLGLKEFNARARAENFTLDDLRVLVPLARRYEMRVLVTVNILIKQIELPALIRVLSALEEIGVDAIIVQDLGVAAIARRYFPGLRLHASTQMAVHNLGGVEQAARWGFKRVVVAREMAATELRRIRAAIPRSVIEIEAFCHGSLCYSYSGLCFFSGAKNARSGNRGECAYTCRKPYKVLNEEAKGFLFSMRDLDTAEDLEKLVGAGVDTLKIEGRKKDALYVASSVKLYRAALDRVAGRSTLRPSAPALARTLLADQDPAALAAAARADLELSFQRQGTSFFLNGRYHENVIDLDNPTHSGVLVGTIRVVHGRMRVVTRVPLERFDGLRVVPGGEIKHGARYDRQEIEFGLRDMHINGRRTPTAAAGETVDIELPSDHQPKDGDLLFKIRSDELRRRLDKLTVAPAGERLRPGMPLEINVDAASVAGEVELIATATRWGNVVARATVRTPQSLVRSGAQTFSADAQRIFDVVDDFAPTVTVTSAGALCPSGVDLSVLPWFVPQKVLKDLKRALSAELTTAWPEFVAARRTAAEAALCAGTAARPELQSSTPNATTTKFAIKTDRLEYLETLRVGAGALPVNELIFEPKRAYLDIKNTADLTAKLRAFKVDTGWQIRMAIPTVVRAWDVPLLELFLQAMVAADICGFEAGNPGALAMIREWRARGLVTAAQADDVVTDFTAYALNLPAADAWRTSMSEEHPGLRRLCLSIEDDRENLQALLSAWRTSNSMGETHPEAIIYKDTPLFIAEACSLTALHGGCPGPSVCHYRTLHIENHEGERFYAAHEGCKSIVYAEAPYAVTHKLRDLWGMGVRHFRIDLLTRPYTASDLEKILMATADAWRATFAASATQQPAITPISGTHSANFDGRLL